MINLLICSIISKKLCVVSEKNDAKVFNFPYIRNRRSSYDYDMGNASLNSNLIFLGIFPAHDLSLSNTMLIGWQN